MCFKTYKPRTSLMSSVLGLNRENEAHGKFSFESLFLTSTKRQEGPRI